MTLVRDVKDAFVNEQGFPRDPRFAVGENARWETQTHDQRWEGVADCDIECTRGTVGATVTGLTAYGRSTQWKERRGIVSASKRDVVLR